MKINEFDEYIKSFMDLASYSSVDCSKNGLQVSRSDSDIKKIAFAVDACKETISRASSVKADVLFVHHGLFWGHEQTITGIHYDRIASLIRNDIALYACHLPLDSHAEVGNNIGLAKRLNLKDVEPFGKYKGSFLGFYGYLEEEKSVSEVAKLLFPNGEQPKSILPFGKLLNRKIAIISGEGANEIDQAVNKKCDLYVTGEIKHSVYHTVAENKINLIEGGHYQTETVGVSLLKEKIEKDLGIETVFIDIPTGF